MQKNQANNTKIIEMFGVPGCGKTTLTNDVIKRLKKQGYSICTENNIFRSGSKFEKLSDFLRSFMKKDCRNFNVTLFLIIIPYLKSHKNLYIFRRYSKLVRFNKLVNDILEKNKYDYILLSEGYIQLFLSIFDFSSKNLSVKNTEKFHLALENKDILFFYCHLPSLIAEKRLLKRNELNDHFLSMTNMQRSEIYKRREDNNYIVSEVFQVIIIDTIDIKTQEVLNKISEINKSNSDYNYNFFRS